MSESRNGLRLQSIQSKSESFSEESIDDLSTFVSSRILPMSKGVFFVAYLDYRVIIDRYHDREIGLCDPEDREAIQPKYLKRLRVFNDNAELHLWRSGTGFNGRFRQDGKGEEIQIIEAEQALIGAKPRFIQDSALIELAEERGGRLLLPFSEAQFTEKPKRLFLKTRNYIESIAETGQASYVDCRFAGFTTDNQQALS